MTPIYTWLDRPPLSTKKITLPSSRQLNPFAPNNSNPPEPSSTTRAQASLSAIIHTIYGAVDHNCTHQYGDEPEGDEPEGVPVLGHPSAERGEALVRQEELPEGRQWPVRIDLAAPLEDVAVAVVVVARRAGLGEHVRDVVGRRVPVERRAADTHGAKPSKLLSRGGLSGRSWGAAPIRELCLRETPIFFVGWDWEVLGLPRGERRQEEFKGERAALSLGDIKSGFLRCRRGGCFNRAVFNL